MECRPAQQHFLLAAWERAFHDLDFVDVYRNFLSAVYGVEVGRVVLAVVNINLDSPEHADRWHLCIPFRYHGYSIAHCNYIVNTIMQKDLKIVSLQRPLALSGKSYTIAY